MKTIIKLVIFLLLAILLGLWSPWLKLDLNIADIFGVETPDPISGLQVISLAGDLQVFVDGILAEGTASSAEDIPVIVDGIEPGEKNIRVERISPITGAYWSFNKIINFEESKDVVITYAIGPELEFSEGYIINARERNEEQHNIEIITNVEEATISIDNIQQELTNNQVKTTISLDTQHKIKVTKPGFEDVELAVLPEEQEERDKFEDYIITLDIQLMYQPVQVE